MKLVEVEGEDGTRGRGGNGVDMVGGVQDAGDRTTWEVEEEARRHRVAHPKPRSWPSRDGVACCCQAAPGSWCGMFASSTSTAYIHTDTCTSRGSVYLCVIQVLRAG